jgi:hypothetical protein
MLGSVEKCNEGWVIARPFSSYKVLYPYGIKTILARKVWRI